MDHTQTGQEKVVEANTTPVMPDQTKPADAPQTAPEPDQLPEGVSERTREQFEKLKEHNRKLAEENERLKQPPMPSVLESLNPEPTYQPQASNYQNLSQQQVDQIASQLVDKDGYVDIQAVEAALAQANREAAEAKTKLRDLEQRVTRYEHDTQTKTAHEKHPYLDPASPEFDPKFYNLVKNELIGQMMVGKQDLLAAAERVKREYYDPKAKATAQAEATQQKQQAAVEARSQATANPNIARDYSPENQADLVKRTMKGDPNALYERLKRSGY